MSLLDDMPQKWLDYAVARTLIQLPNCFTWSTARVSWAVNKAQPLDSAGRVTYASQLWNQHSPEFSQSQTPVVGALMIWDIWGYIDDNGYVNHGHVANVESINSDGTITWSQSNYGGTLFEIVRGNPKTMYNGTFKGYLIHKDLNKGTSTVVKKSNMEAEDWAVRFKNDTPITIHKDASNGSPYGSFVKGETQVYTHKGVGNGHRWIGWTEKLNGKDQFYVCAISGSETRGQDMWVDLIDPQTLKNKTTSAEVKKEEQKKEEKPNFEKNIKYKGVDISDHNGDVDISKYDFVIIRASYGTTVDGWFNANVMKCQKANKPFGIYVYDYALDSYGGIEQAEYVLKLIKGIDIPLGIWFDLEDADGFKAKNNILTKEHISHVTKLFCDTVKAAGYYIGVYTTKYWQDTYVNTSYPLWIANWGTNDGTVQGDFSDIAVMHQYSAYGGIDYDALYVDFEKLKSNPVQSSTNEDKVPAKKEDEAVNEDNENEYKSLFKLILELIKKMLELLSK